MSTFDSGEDHVSPIPQSDVASRDVPQIVGSNLRRLRKAQGLSLERLAELSGVSRAMLGQIETAKSVPTVSLLWRVADALGVQVATLVATEAEPTIVVLHRETANTLVSSDGRYTSRSLTGTRQRSTGFFELTFAPGHSQDFPAAAIGTRQTLVVSQGQLSLTIADLPVTLDDGDAVAFEASSHYTIENTADSLATAYLVVIEPSA